MLQKTIETVLSLDDLRPSDTVNSAFSALVSAVIHDTKTKVDTAVCRQVQAVSSEAESYMEAYWARRVIAAQDPKTELSQFPYVNNYAELVRREIRLVEATGLRLGHTSRVCMIGAGPLPMTGLEFMKQRQVRIDHVDISAQALALCSLVGGRLGLRCGHIGGAGADVVLEAREYDLVLVAGLAGSTIAEKQAIVDNVLPALKPGGRLLLRSAAGSRRLLYPAFPAKVLRRVHLLSEYHPNDDVINSVFVYEKA